MAPSKSNTSGGQRITGRITTAAKIPSRQGNRNHPSNSNAAQIGTPTSIPLTIQQNLLNIFVRAFQNRLSSANVSDLLYPLLQEVKGHLYERNFEKAFGRNDYLEAYAVRWSASRSLAYLHIFHNVVQFLPQNIESKTKEGENVDGNSANPRVDAPLATKLTCLGGGAGAELCSFASLHSMKQIRSSEEVEPTTHLPISVSLIDMAPWQPVYSSLYDCLTSAPPVSLYASASVKASNAPLVASDHFHGVFHRINVLAPNEKQSMFNNILAESSIITIMFTLNELYSASLADTQKLLLNITAVSQIGTLLLVVDSPGSYSIVQLNSSEKKYPMKWLLDHTLLTLAPTVHTCSSANTSTDSTADRTATEDYEPGGRNSKSGENQDAVWEKLISEESTWFRIPENLKYPIELENMRYQIHLYKRL